MHLSTFFTFVSLLESARAISFPALGLPSLPLPLSSISDPLSSATDATPLTDSASLTGTTGLEDITHLTNTATVERGLGLDGLEDLDGVNDIHNLPASLPDISSQPSSLTGISSTDGAASLADPSTIVGSSWLSGISSLTGASIIKRQLGLTSLPLSLSSITSPLSSLTGATSLTGSALTGTSIVKRALGIAGPPLSLPSISNPLSSLTSGPLFRRQSACPSEWFQISGELSELFVTDLQCNDAARAAIRASFHDCFPGGGCDGSLGLADEMNRQENVPLIPHINRLVEIADRYNVSKADMFVFAGNHAVASCPLGPRTRTFIGRKDTTTVAPTGQVPLADISSQQALSEFKARGFTAKELAALIGAHTTARQFTTDPSVAGRSLDSTPGIWDILYYAQTLLGIAPFTLASDARIAHNPETSFWFTFFSVNQLGWNDAFASAMLKMTLLGAPSVRAMADCTAALPV